VNRTASAVSVVAASDATSADDVVDDPDWLPLRSFRFPELSNEAEAHPAIDQYRSSFFGLILSYPFAIVIYIIVAFEFAAYVLIRLTVTAWEALRLVFRPTERRLSSSLRRATTRRKWYARAGKLDSLLGNGTNLKASFDRLLLRSTQGRLNLPHEDAHAMFRELRNACAPNLGGIANESLYSHRFTGENEEISSFAAAVTAKVQSLLHCDLPFEVKRSYFAELDRLYGRSALLLSGGAGNGYYHLGVVKALLAADSLPSIVSGSSAGALMGAVVCTRTDGELREFIKPECFEYFQPCAGGVLVMLRRWVETGYCFDLAEWSAKLNEALGGPPNLTFAEAYIRSRRVLNISINDGLSHTVVLSHVSAPDVVIWSAVLASAALPLLLPSVQLQAKRADGTVEPFSAFGRLWRDGSILNDLPFDHLHAAFNVNFSIVSQVEPHLVPFFFNAAGSAGKPAGHRGGRGWRGGFILSFAEALIKLDMKKWLTIMHDLELSPTMFGTSWSKIFLQPSYGAVTILPSLGVRDYLYLFQDSDMEGFRRYIVGGERAVWPKLTAIANHRSIELAIAEAQRTLTRMQPAN
jgi:predicted acylesterase/phospholipase RssA